MRKVLIVDDNLDMCAVLRRFVEFLGFVALVANSGFEGLERALAEKPDLILIDLLMPEVDGYELTRTLRASFETRDIPILGISASTQESDLRACLDAGCNGYLIKPFTIEELQRKIAEIAPKHGAR